MMVQTRRDVVGLLGAGLLAGAVGLPGRASAATKITVLNWQGYGTDEPWAIEAFRKMTGIEVVHDYFNAESEMLTKLRTNPGTYDVVLINSARVRQATAESLLDAIDLQTIPNAANLSPQFLQNASIVEDGKTYGVAWLWGMNALAVRDGRPKPDSYAALGDKSYAGKVGFYDDAVNSVAVGALMTGQDMNDPKDLEPIKAWLKTLKPNIKTLWSSEDQWDKAFAAGDFDLAVFWSGAAVRSRRNYKLPVDFVVPKEGAVGWFDTLCIPASSTGKDAAKTFINYMIDPGFYVEWATKVGAPASANTAAMDKLPADDLNRQVHDPKYLATMTLMAPLPDERREAFTNMWQEVKAFYAA